MKLTTWIGVSIVSALLGLILMPVTACGCSNISAPKTATLSSVKQGSTAIQIYLADYDEVLPAVQDQSTFRRLVGEYLKNDKVLADVPDYQVHIAFNTRLSNVSAKTLEKPEDVIALSTPFAASPTDPVSFYIAGFADGSARALPAKTWNADYADLLDRNYPRVSQTFLPASP